MNVYAYTRYISHRNITAKLTRICKDIKMLKRGNTYANIHSFQTAMTRIFSKSCFRGGQTRGEEAEYQDWSYRLIPQPDKEMFTLALPLLAL
jgi:hypothetical protein